MDEKKLEELFEKIRQNASSRSDFIDKLIKDKNSPYTQKLIDKAEKFLEVKPVGNNNEWKLKDSHQYSEEIVKMLMKGGITKSQLEEALKPAKPASSISAGVGAPHPDPKINQIRAMVDAIYTDARGQQPAPPSTVSDNDIRKTVEDKLKVLVDSANNHHIRHSDPESFQAFTDKLTSFNTLKKGLAKSIHNKFSRISEDTVKKVFDEQIGNKFKEVYDSACDGKIDPKKLKEALDAYNNISHTMTDRLNPTGSLFSPQQKKDIDKILTENKAHLDNFDKEFMAALKRKEEIEHQAFFNLKMELEAAEVKTLAYHKKEEQAQVQSNDPFAPSDLLGPGHYMIGEKGAVAEFMGSWAFWRDHFELEDKNGKLVGKFATGAFKTDAGKSQHWDDIINTFSRALADRGEDPSVITINQMGKSTFGSLGGKNYLDILVEKIAKKDASVANKEIYISDDVLRENIQTFAGVGKDKVFDEYKQKIHDHNNAVRKEKGLPSLEEEAAKKQKLGPKS